MIKARNAADSIFVEVTKGNLDNDLVSIARHHDFFPPDILGKSKRGAGLGKPVVIELDGLGQEFSTDIAADPKTGKARGHFRERRRIREFYERHRVRPGEKLQLRQIADRRYRLSVCRSNGKSGVFRVAEFFAGIGLVRLALEKHGFRVVFANDIDPDKEEMYRANFPADEFRLGDIHRLGPDDLPDVDLATASFPCNDLSIAGAMNGIHAGQSSAFWPLVRLLEASAVRRPPFLLLENVPGFLMSHDGKDFESALMSVNRLGYACDTFMLDAANFVPQSRQRLFVIGKLGVEGQSTLGLESSPLRPESLVEFIHAHPAIRWHIRPLPPPPKRTQTLDEIIEKDLPNDDPAWWSEERTAYFMNQLSDRHAAIAETMIKGRTFSYATAFRRVRKGRSMAELRNDGLAGCLRTPRGGSGRQILFKAGRGRRQVRLLTARECARLQGVPDSYRIEVALNQALFGFGDAVCVPVIEWIAQHYLEPVMQLKMAELGDCS